MVFVCSKTMCPPSGPIFHPRFFLIVIILDSLKQQEPALLTFVKNIFYVTWFLSLALQIYRGNRREIWLVSQDCLLPPQFLPDFHDFRFYKTARACSIIFPQNVFYVTPFLQLALQIDGVIDGAEAVAQKYHPPLLLLSDLWDFSDSVEPQESIPQSKFCTEDFSRYLGFEPCVVDMRGGMRGIWSKMTSLHKTANYRLSFYLIFMIFNSRKS